MEHGPAIGFGLLLWIHSSAEAALPGLRPCCPAELLHVEILEHRGKKPLALGMRSLWPGADLYFTASGRVGRPEAALCVMASCALVVCWGVVFIYLFFTQETDNLLE